MVRLRYSAVGLQAKNQFTGNGQVKGKGRASVKKGLAHDMIGVTIWASHTVKRPNGIRVDYSS